MNAVDVNSARLDFLVWRDRRFLGDDVDLNALLHELLREIMHVRAYAAYDPRRIFPREDEGSHNQAPKPGYPDTRLSPGQSGYGVPVSGARSTCGAPARATASSISKYCCSWKWNIPAMALEGNDCTRVL